MKGIIMENNYQCQNYKNGFCIYAHSAELALEKAYNIMYDGTPESESITVTNIDDDSDTASRCGGYDPT